MTTATTENRSRVREKVLLDLARRDKTNAGETFRGITEASGTALDVARVGIWRLFADGSAMACEDQFVLAEHRHEHGQRRNAVDCPAYFNAVLAGRPIVVDDARRDVRTCGLPEMRDGITSRMDIPIWHHGSLYGVVSYEHHEAARRWQQHEIEFANNLADVAALTLEASERRALEDRWATVIDGISEIIMAFDRDGRLVQSNARMRPLLEKLHGDVFTIEDRLRVLEYRDLNGLVIPYEDWPGPRALRGEHVHQVFGVWHKVEGLVGYFRLYATPLYEGKQLSGFVGVATDVTDELQFERLKADFLATLGFQMKSPVSTVRVTTHDLLRSEPMEPMWHEELEAIERASRRMERVIDQVVEISALTSVKLVREPVEIRGLVEDEIDRVGPAAQRHRIHLFAPSNAKLNVDRSRVAKVIERLLDNAIRYSPGGGDIDVELTVTDTEIVLSVRDKGIGIPADKQPRMFEMFFRAHARTANDFGGLGLGLYLSREVARLHGGDLWFESVEGQGSAFHLRLPRTRS